VSPIVPAESPIDASWSGRSRCPADHGVRPITGAPGLQPRRPQSPRWPRPGAPGPAASLRRREV